MNTDPVQTDPRNTILNTAQTVLAARGGCVLPLPALAQACDMEVDAIRAHFSDYAGLLSELLHRQVRALAAVISAVHAGEPELLRLRRAAYLAATRTPRGHTEAHTLLLRDRHLLLEGDAETIAQAHLALGVRLAGPLAEQALALLDSLAFDAPRIEATLAHLGARCARLHRAMARRRAAAAAMQPPVRLNLSRKEKLPHAATPTAATSGNSLGDPGFWHWSPPCG